MSVELWTEKYRPTELEDFVWANPTMRLTVEKYIAEGALPHLLLSGKPGTGKTSLIWLMLRMLKIPKSDIKYLNASKLRRVDDLEDVIDVFFKSHPLGKTEVKYLIMDEFDGVSVTAQRMLRSEMETYSRHTRVLATCNYPQKIIGAIMGRFQKFEFQALDRDSFIIRANNVLESEGVDFDYDTLNAHVTFAYPDLRNCINTMQQASLNGRLGLPKGNPSNGQEYMLEVVDLFKAGKFMKARTLILDQAQVEEYPDLYRFLYQNLDLFGSTEIQQDEALQVLGKAVVNHTIACDVEINLAATLASLTQIART